MKDQLMQQVAQMEDTYKGLVYVLIKESLTEEHPDTLTKQHNGPGSNHHVQQVSPRTDEHM